MDRTSPFRGHKHTLEARRKISEATKGKNNPNWGKRGSECSWYGRKQSEEEKEKRRKIMSGEKNPMYGRIPWNKGLTKETDSRVRATSDKLKGRELSSEWRDKISKARIGKYSGENHPNWRGGLKDNPYGLDFNEPLRNKTRMRDDYICVLCSGIDVDRELQVHHIDYDKTNNDPLNLVSLCLSCHVKTNYDRAYWVGFFQTLMRKSHV